MILTFFVVTLQRYINHTYMKGYTWFISQRMNLSSSGKGSSPAIKVAVIAVALSIAIMILAIAIVNGFKTQITDKVTGFNSEIILYPTYASEKIDDNLVELTKPLREILDNENYIESYSLISSLPAILKTETDFKGIYLRGVPDDYDFSFIENNLIDGKIADYSQKENSNHVLISTQIANELGLKVNDEINAYFISQDIRVRKLKIVGLFNTHFEDYDNNFIFGDIGLIQDLCGFTSTQGSAIEINTYDIDKVNDDTASLFGTLNTAIAEGKLQATYNLNNVKNTGSSYFGWLSLLDTNVVVILTLMIVVACFSLVAAMLILILEKIQLIGILKTLGSSNDHISKIFIQLSIKIGIIGLAIGNFIAIALLYIQDKYHLIQLDPQSYYIDFVPVEINYTSIIVTNILTIVVMWLILIIPSRMVSKISPSETIKYE